MHVGQNWLFYCQQYYQLIWYNLSESGSSKIIPRISCTCRIVNLLFYIVQAVLPWETNSCCRVVCCTGSYCHRSKRGRNVKLTNKLCLAELPYLFKGYIKKKLDTNIWYDIYIHIYIYYIYIFQYMKTHLTSFILKQWFRSMFLLRGIQR